MTGSGIRVPGYSLWFFNFIQKLLTADPEILRLMGKNPFPDHPPAFIRALFYQYRFTTAERKGLDRRLVASQSPRFLSATHVGETLQKL